MTHHIAVDLTGPQLVLIRNALLACYEASELIEPQEVAARLGVPREEVEQLLRRLSGIVQASGL